MTGYDKLERYMATLNAKELKRFGDYLESRYFKIDPSVRDFGSKYLIWYSSGAGGKKVDVHEIWRQVYHDDPFNDGKWRKMRSKLLDSLEKFLQQVAWENETSSLRLPNLLLKELDHRGLDQDFEQVLEKAAGSVSEETIVSEGDLVELFRLWEHSYNFHTTRLDPNKDGASDAYYLQKRMKAFRRYVMFDTLKTITGLENRRYMGWEGLSVELPDGFADFLVEERRGGSPMIQCYVLLLDSLEDFKKPKIEPFLAHFLKVAPSLPANEKVQLFTFAANIAIRQYLWSPDHEAAERLLELYKLGLQEQTMIGSNGLIPVNHFKNICVIGCMFKKNEFVANFITDYRDKLLITEETMNVLIYCEALLLFGNRDFLGCWKRLNEVASKKYLKVEIKSLGIKAQYELGDVRVLESLLSSFERWLQRSQLPPLRKEPQLKRVRLIRRIMDLKPGNKKEKELLQKIVLEEGILDGDWLMEKLDAKL